MHRASAALTDAATVLRADEPERVAQHPEQRRLRIDVVADGVRAAVDGETQHARSPVTRRGDAATRGPTSLGEIATARNRAPMRLFWSFLNPRTAWKGWLLQSPPIPEGDNPPAVYGYI